MYIRENLIDFNEMTRCGESLSNIDGVIVYSVEIDECYGRNYIKYIENLKYQSDKYLSYHYIIEENGLITKIIPEGEIAYHSPEYNINEKYIGIGVMGKNKESFNNYQKKSLRYLLKYFNLQYNIKNNNIKLLNDFISTRDTSYYIDNPLEWKKVKT